MKANQLVKKQGFQISISYFFALLLIPLTIPRHFLNETILLTLINLATILIFLFLLVQVILKKRINTFLCFALLFLLWRIVSSVFFSEGVADIYNTLRILSLIMFINLYMKKHAYSVTKSLAILFSVYVVINLISVFLFPSGIVIENPRPDVFRGIWFLGNDSQFALYLIPNIIFLLIYYEIRNKKLTLLGYFQFFIIILSIIKINSVTAMLASILTLLFIAIIMIFKKNSFFNFSRFSLVYILVWVFLILMEKLSLVQNLILALGKDVTLSGRTRIWEAALNMISESPWYGYGINAQVMLTKTEFVAHNILLQIILESGYIGLVLFLICFVLVGLEIKKFRNTKIGVYLLIGIFGFLIGGLTEAYILNHLFVFMAFIFYLEYIYKSSKNMIGSNHVV